MGVRTVPKSDGANATSWVFDKFVLLILPRLGSIGTTMTKRPDKCTVLTIIINNNGPKKHMKQTNMN
eukprot:3649246-Amphidinium_carterae.1